ncbi:carbonyl reductase [NADPH] 1 isoform X1 [Sciurus carolinensis]|uniref:carbonyl reductase [NADPH] 1 isoform X1 n=1 Tax=Sciurus carolinensis TaxID=30640 RepID=UPI001FB28A2F|nr:carbonyl reductase [NADPH] 1 isoform X1 [Sciurus carolinensis]
MPIKTRVLRRSNCEAHPNLQDTALGPLWQPGLQENHALRGAGLLLRLRLAAGLAGDGNLPCYSGDLRARINSEVRPARRCPALPPAMSSCRRVALVTGANKGIGFAIVRDLCRQFSGDVVLTARDEARGRAAVQQLQAEGLSPRFHPLDIDDMQSIRALRDFLRREYGGLDVLVNNAGIAFKMADPTPFHIQAEVTMKTNFFGTRDVCTELLPLMKPQAHTGNSFQMEIFCSKISANLVFTVLPYLPHDGLECLLGRVVNVSSMLSLVNLKRCSPELQQKFRSETITEEELVGLMNKFVEDAKNGVHQKEGWPNSAYGVSKIGVTVLSRIHAWKLSEQRGGDKILLNACCPGWVRTDMAGPSATKSPEEGAETPVYLALLPPEAEGPHGQFVEDKKINQW